MRKPGTSRRTQQRHARQEVERQTAEIICRAVSSAFNEGIQIAAKLNPGSHSGHFSRMFQRLVRERIDY